MKGAYLDGPFGQIHYRSWGTASELAPLICLPPSPFSGRAYTTLAPMLSKRRQVIAVDYPGYGNSTACPSAPKISDYANSVSSLISHIAPSTGADLLGFHTGCLVAAQTAVSVPELVRSIVLADVPYFSPDKQVELLATMGSPVELKPELDMLEKTWAFCVTKFNGKIPLERCFNMFVDHINSGEQANLAFAAAFQYPCKEAFEKLTQPCTVIATKAGLYDQSVKTAAAIAHAALIEIPEITSAVLEQGASTIAPIIDKVLQES